MTSDPTLPTETAIHTFAPARSTSLADTLVIQIRRAIVNRLLAPGDRLVETELAEQFEVSRLTVRQALLQLRFEGLVDMRPRRGVIVTRMSSQVAHEVCTIRGLLEGWAARSACFLLTEDDLRRMRLLSQEMGECIVNRDIYRVVELDIEFHRFITQRDENGRLKEQWQTLNTLHGALMSSRLEHYHYDPETVVRLHNNLCDVLAQRAPDEAEQEVRLHYMGTRWEDDEEEES